MGEFWYNDWIAEYLRDCKGDCKHIQASITPHSPAHQLERFACAILTMYDDQLQTGVLQGLRKEYTGTLSPVLYACRCCPSST